MIEYIRGKIAEVNPAAAVLETPSGVAYRLNITLTTFSAIQNDGEARLYVHEIIREDAWTLYGFSDPRERELFRALIGVSGVGAATAALILSSLQGDDLSATIGSGDVKRLKAIKGIGAKTAERIIVDLRDKIGDVAVTAAPAAVGPASVTDYEEALAALTMLGFDRKASQKALKAIFEADPAVKVEAAIKKALAML